MTQIEIAEGIARCEHEGQFRKFGADKGKPYIVHPERVAKALTSVETKVADDILVAAAWLHDVVEDTNTTISDLIKRGVDRDVTDIVLHVTKLKCEFYVDYIGRVGRSGRAAIELKLADIHDNLESCPKGSLRDKYELARQLLMIYLGRYYTEDRC